MRKAFSFSLALLVLLFFATSAPQALGKGGRGLATITGTVRDSKGSPLAGAVIQLIREGANRIVRQTRTAADGTFTAKIPTGRYSLKAIAEGFQEVVFSSVQVRPSDEIIYRFNLEPAGSGRTTVEQRADRDSAKWRLRAAHSRRSILQAREGEDSVIAAVEAAEADANQSPEAESEEPQARGKGSRRAQGVIETYAATSSNIFAPGFVGINFAVATPATDRLDLIFAGQAGVGAGAPHRLETTARLRAGERHRLGLSLGEISLGTFAPASSKARNDLGQMSVRAIDEWIVRDGVVVVFGLDYSRFLGAGNAAVISPRLGIQLDANARTRVRAAYAPGGDEARTQSAASFEGSEVVFKQPSMQPIALVGGRAVMERSRRLEIGVERVLDNESSLEATAFLDTTSGRGVGLLSMPLSAFSGESGAPLIDVANQEGAARGVRVVYTRRLGHVWTASAAYSLGRGQRLSPRGIANPAEIFSNGSFQTGALQLGADLSPGTHVRTVLRFSPQATVFAIDPFAGRLAVYDPSLSVQVTQELPRFGLPLRAEAIIDARNLFDIQARTDNGEVLTRLGLTGRSLRGGILVRF